jgi:hypothetical protein
MIAGRDGMATACAALAVTVRNAGVRPALVDFVLNLAPRTYCEAVASGLNCATARGQATRRTRSRRRASLAQP